MPSVKASSVSCMIVFSCSTSTRSISAKLAFSPNLALISSSRLQSTLLPDQNQNQRSSKKSVIRTERLLKKPFHFKSQVINKTPSSNKRATTPR